MTEERVGWSVTGVHMDDTVDSGAMAESGQGTPGTVAGAGTGGVSRPEVVRQALRRLPAVDELLQSDAVAGLLADQPRDEVVGALRQALEGARADPCRVGASDLGRA